MNIFFVFLFILLLFIPFFYSLRAKYFSLWDTSNWHLTEKTSIFFDQTIFWSKNLLIFWSKNLLFDQKIFLFCFLFFDSTGGSQGWCSECSSTISWRWSKRETLGGDLIARWPVDSCWLQPVGINRNGSFYRKKRNNKNI